MIELKNLTEQGLNANTAVELRKAGQELGIKGAAKGRKADLIAEIMKLVEAAKAEAEKKTKRPTKCVDCGKRRISKDVVGPNLCDICLDYAGWENTHSDYGHNANSEEVTAEAGDAEDGKRVEGCPVCFPELDNRYTFNGRSRAGMVIVAKGTEVHKSLTFKRAAEAVGWTVEITSGGEDYIATATRTNGDTIELAWNGRAYDYAASSATIKGKVRKVRNLKEALRIL